jgi:hypothetical protein
LPVGGKAEEALLGFGEPAAEPLAERGSSRLGRCEPVGVTMVCEDGIRLGKGVPGSRGEAIVDMVIFGRQSGPCRAFLWIEVQLGAQLAGVVEILCGEL